MMDSFSFHHIAFEKRPGITFDVNHGTIRDICTCRRQVITRLNYLFLLLVTLHQTPTMGLNCISKYMPFITILKIQLSIFYSIRHFIPNFIL